MEQQKIKHFMVVPFTGLGNYNGYRGAKWLKSRIQIFKQFVIPSLQNQTNKNFILHCCWRAKERDNPYVKELIKYLEGIKEFKTIHTFHGILFWDDKYPDLEARDRLLSSIHASMGDLINLTADCDFILETLQPSDDCYHKTAIQGIQTVFNKLPALQAFGFKNGYLINYNTKEVAEYNPLTNPPFFTIKFPREVFIDPLKHAQYISIKFDSKDGKYKAGTPYPSHEYIGEALNYGTVEHRGFLVGTHGTNISTHWNIPYKGESVNQEVLKEFGIYDVPPLKIRIGLFKRLPHRVQRKLRYWFGELFYNKIYVKFFS